MAKKKTAPLTADEERFVDEYLIDRNGTAAYIRAFPGTKRGTAATMSCLLLKKLKIASAIREGRKALSRRSRVSADSVVRGIARLAFYDIGGAMDLTKDEPTFLSPREIPYELRLAIQAVKVTRRKLKSEDGEDYEIENIEYKFADKLSAFDKLSKHLGLYKELPPLEVLLALLPPDLREPVRASLAASLLEGAGGGGGADREPDPALPAAGPDGGVPEGGADAGPVAGGVSERPVEAADAPVLSPKRKDHGGGGEDPSPLFE